MEVSTEPRVPTDQPPHPKPHEIHIVVELDPRTVPVTFDHSPVTGREIRQAAGVPLTDDLSRVEHGNPVGGNIGLDTAVAIANGDRFLATQPKPHEIHIVVELDGRAVPVTFDHTPVTGREIRQGAGVPLTDDLSRVEHGKPVGGNIGPDTTVAIANGDRFLAIPSGTVS